MYKFKFADIGEGLHEGKVGEVFVNVGDQVKEGDSLFSVETDKVTSDIPAPVTGKILKILIREGEMVHVGDVTFHFDTLEKEEEITKEKMPAEEEEKAEPDGASVVGQVAISNKLLTFGNFSNSSKSDSEIKKNEQAEELQLGFTNQEKAINKNQDFDIDLIRPIGEGEKVDVVVIGAGPGGYTAAEFISKAGYKTVVIEREYIGGVCLNVGCIPTKTLLKSSKILSQVQKADYYGVSTDAKTIKLNWKRMQERKEEARLKLRNGVKFLLKSANVESVLGEAIVIDRYNVKVNNRHFTTKVIILATGSTPVKLSLPGFEKAIKDGIMIDSTGALDLAKIPKTLTVVGGGVIGLEFAILYHELGSKVTVLEGTKHLLGVMDNQVRHYARKMLLERGIDVQTDAMVKEFKNGFLIYEKSGKKEKVESDKILIAVGRKPNNLGLDKSLNITVGKRGEFVVNNAFQTSIKNIFAIGDCNAEVMLAHVAYKQAHVVKSVITKEKRQYFDARKNPSCVYTHPEISSVGYTEEDLKAQNIEYVKSVWNNQNVGRIISDGSDQTGFTKLLVKKDTGELLGAHIINDHSSDMISEIVTLMELEGTVYELANSIHPHPSIAEAIYEAAIHAVAMLKSQH